MAAELATLRLRETFIFPILSSVRFWFEKDQFPLVQVLVALSIVAFVVTPPSTTPGPKFIVFLEKLMLANVDTVRFIYPWGVRESPVRMFLKLTSLAKLTEKLTNVIEINSEIQNLLFSRKKEYYKKWC